jgi:hypothetical protein
MSGGDVLGDGDHQDRNVRMLTLTSIRRFWECRAVPGVRICIAGVLVALGFAAPAGAAGVPELLDQPGYLIKTRSNAGDGFKVIDRVRRVGLRDGRVKATVNVIARVDPAYRRRKLDSIKLAVRCGEVLWIARETYVDSPDGVGSDVITRIYRLTSTDSVQLTGSRFDAAGFSARDFACDSDESGAVYLGGWAGDDFFARVRPDGGFDDVSRRGGIGGTIVTRSGIAFKLRRGRVAFVGRDGTRRVFTAGYRRNWYQTGTLVPVGRGLRLVEHNSAGTAHWLRRLSQRTRGTRFDGIRVDPLGTFCGGLVITRVITLSSTEVIFRRAGRVVRRVRSEASPKMVDANRGTIMLLGRAYAACGADSGKTLAKLSTGSSSASNAIGPEDFN